MKKNKKQKKVVRSKKVESTTRAEIVVRVEQLTRAMSIPSTTDLAEPMTGKGQKLTIPKTWMSSNQLTKILQKTPAQYVYQKPGKGGGKFDYVTTSYVTKALNYIFGWNWDFDVIEHGIEGGQVWVKGQLTVRGNQEGQTILKTQFGRNDIKMKKDGKGMLDFGNDMKGAASDALKKCASMLGIASDIYGKADYKMESGNEPVEPRTPSAAPQAAPGGKKELKPDQVLDADGQPTYVCEKDGDPISDQTAEFSLKMYGHRLCREHQVEAKPKK